MNRIVQRYRCLRCGTTFSEAQPLAGLRVDFKQACQVVHLLCEGMGIRAIERFTGLHRDTVLSILESAGAKCVNLLHEKIQHLKCSWVQVDEIHGIVFSKQRNTPDGCKDRGEFFTYLSVDMSSKLVINWHTGKRNSENTMSFMRELRSRMDGRFQLTTDAFQGYWRGGGAVRQVFGNSIDYAIETKVYGRKEPTFPEWYSPPTVIGIRRTKRIGKPEMKLATTCHAERMNLSVRLFNRRFTRKTLGYSKKLENLRYAVALFVAHFNFCRVHSAHGRTPAQAANLTDHQWTIEEMLMENN